MKSCVRSIGMQEGFEDTFLPSLKRGERRWCVYNPHNFRKFYQFIILSYFVLREIADGKNEYTTKMIKVIIKY